MCFQNHNFFLSIFLRSKNREEIEQQQGTPGWIKNTPNYEPSVNQIVKFKIRPAREESARCSEPAFQ